MKRVVLVVCLLLAFQTVNSNLAMKHLVEQIYKQELKSVKNDKEKCELCLNILDTIIQNVLNIFLNAGVAATCQEGCAIVAQKFFNGTLEQIVDLACTFGCLYLGMEEFVKVLEDIDIDPIYYCQELGGCKYNDYSKAKIDQITVVPLKGAQGTTFDITVAYTVINTTGTGDIVIDIKAPDHVPLGDQFLLYDQEPNHYSAVIKVDTTPNQDCPAPDCEQFLPGVYPVEVALCDGQCDGKHPHHKLFGTGTVNFTITG